MENVSDIMVKLSIWAIPVIFAITVHEVAHGWVASKLGDKTALMLGRITLNPIKHIDPIGTILVPILCLMIGGLIFGWAKPVPVTWRNLKNKRRDPALVALAGPGSNLLMALFWGAIAKLAAFGVHAGFQPLLLFVLMGVAGIQINLMLGILNLIPIPPLDGSHVAESVMPRRWAYYYERISPYGFMILLLLMFSGVLIAIMGPPYSFLMQMISSLFGLGTPGLYY